ncbi:MAG: DMT family transporter, partial [Bdellovibrionota bacterium]
MSWAILLGLLACNAVWAVTPILGKFLLRSYGPYQVGQLRYGAALLTAFLILSVFRWLRPDRLTSFRTVVSRRNFHWIASLGIISFFASPIMQYLGLIRSTATANSLMVAIEPLFAALLGWLFLRERLNLQEKIGFVIALAGFFLLSNVKPNHLGESLALFNTGNLFFLAVMPLEATYTIISRRLVGRIEPVSLLIGALAFGFTL